MPVSPPVSGNVMQKSDVSSMHGAARNLINDLGAPQLGRSSLNSAQLGTLVKQHQRVDVGVSVIINADPAPFAQTAANVAAAWQEPAQYILNAGWVIAKPFLLVEFVTLDIFQFTAPPALADGPFWWTLYRESGGVPDVSEAHIRFLQGQSITEVDTGTVINTSRLGHVHTLVRKTLFSGTGNYTLSKLSLRAVVADWRGVGQAVELRGGCIGFYALHHPN